MIELIALIIALVVVIMAWSKVSKAMDWMGAKIDKSSFAIDDLFDSATDQTARGGIISRDSLLDTMMDSEKKTAVRQKIREEFKANLSDDQKKEVETHNTYLNKFINR